MATLSTAVSEKSDVAGSSAARLFRLARLPGLNAARLWSFEVPAGHAA